MTNTGAVVFALDEVRRIDTSGGVVSVSVDDMVDNEIRTYVRDGANNVTLTTTGGLPWKYATSATTSATDSGPVTLDTNFESVRVMREGANLFLFKDLIGAIGGNGLVDATTLLGTGVAGDLYRHNLANINVFRSPQTHKIAQITSATAGMPVFTPSNGLPTIEGLDAVISLTSNVANFTIASNSHSPAGMSHVVELVQDATGGRTFTLAAAVRIPLNQEPFAINAGPNDRTILLFYRSSNSILWLMDFVR